MGDEEDQETPFEEMDGHQLAEKTAWVSPYCRLVLSNYKIGLNSGILCF
jgi:hypothetical protein